MDYIKFWVCFGSFGGLFRLLDAGALFVCFKHKSESKPLGLSRPKTFCFSDESLLPLWKKMYNDIQKCFEVQDEGTKQMEYAVHVWTE